MNFTSIRNKKLGVILMEASKEGSAVPANAGSQQALAISHLSGLVVSKATSSQGFIGCVHCFPPDLLFIHTSWLMLQDSVNILIDK